MKKEKIRSHRIRQAGVPALLAAFMLVLNCCQGPGAQATALLASLVHTSAETSYAGHCHSPAGERNGHHEKPDQKPTTPAKPGHEECVGCNLTPLAHLDSHKIEFQGAVVRGQFDSQARALFHAYPFFSIVAVAHPLRAPHDLRVQKLSSDAYRALATASTALYLTNQSFLI